MSTGTHRAWVNAGNSVLRPTLGSGAPRLPPRQTESLQERALREIAEAAVGRFWDVTRPAGCGRPLARSPMRWATATC